MNINVAGTNAIADYLLSEIRNVRTLMGTPQGSALPVVPTPSGSTPGSSKPPTAADLQAQVRDQNLANTQTLFGIQNTTTDAGSLPPIAGETAQQLAFVAIQSSNIASEFTNIATLFGLGTNTNTHA
jgi:hypothetical protein